MGDFLFRQNIIFDLCKWHQCHQSWLGPTTFA
jgi:hypothetical protein